MTKLQFIGLDADDTLWQNEQFFRLTHARFAELLAEYAGADHLEERLLAAEARNLGQYGFGIKGFTLSMIETAIEVTEGRVPARIIQELIDAGQEMLRHPIELLPDVGDVLERLAGSHALVLVTKGDLLDQERKLAQSGLGDFFSGVEIVSHKIQPTYEGIFRRHRVDGAQAMMVGNSMRSDVIPAIEAGAWGVHVPHEHTWVWERADAPPQQSRYRVLEKLAGLPDLVAEIEQD